MSLFPFNTNWRTRNAQTDTPGVLTQLVSPVMYTPGSPVLDDTDYFVASANMKVGAYTLAHTKPDVGARNVTVTQTAVGAEDTNGTILVTGKDLAGTVITETLTPNAGATVAGAKAFAEITSIVGAGWVIEEGNDTVVLGFGALLGLPDKLSDTAQVLFVSLNNAKQATAPAVTVSSTALASNTVDLDSALDGTPVKIYYLV
jgi:hypothetical protein